jgi:hypothetical protein
MIVSGRLRDLADKLLFGQAYPPHVEVTRDPILIAVDGGVVLEADEQVVDWAFDPRLPSLERGPHRITVTGDGTAVSWTVIKSALTHKSEREIVLDSIDVRETYGLNTDSQHLDQVLHDPALEQHLEWYEVSFTNEELDIIEDLVSEDTEPWGQMVVYREGEAPPMEPSLPADPIERYGQTQAVDTYAGNYLDGGRFHVGFTREADEHLEVLRRRTDKPMRSWQATYSLAYLRELQRRIGEDRKELRGLGIYVTNVSVPIPDNIVEVGTKPLEGSQRGLLFDRYGPAIRVVTT